MLAQAVSVKMLAVIQCRAVDTCSFAGDGHQLNAKTVFRFSIATTEQGGDVTSYPLRSFKNRQNGPILNKAQQQQQQLDNPEAGYGPTMKFLLLYQHSCWDYSIKVIQFLISTSKSNQTTFIFNQLLITLL